MNDLLPGSGATPSDAGVTRSLRASLHAGADPLIVDVTSLRLGAHAGARRLRARRRVATVLTAAAVVAVPSGVALGVASHRSGAAGTQVAAQDSDVDPTPVTVSADPTPTDVPTPTTTSPTASPTTSPSGADATESSISSPTAADDNPRSQPTPTHAKPSAPLPTGDGGPMTFTDRMAVPTSSLWFTVAGDYDTGEYPRQPIVPGQACNEDSDVPDPDSGRQWEWYGEGSSATQVLTGWLHGASATRFAEIAKDSGRCRWLDDPQVVTSTATRWEGTEQSGALSFARVAVLHGDVIVGIEVKDPDGTLAALQHARELADEAVARLVKAGV